MSSLVSIVELDKRKGRGMVAKIDLAEHLKVISVRCDISVLYKPFTQTHCAVCFRRSDPETNIYMCKNCRQFLLCERCNKDELWDLHHLPCQWFTSLPLDVQQGDTDYLRFMLEYSARVQGGDHRLSLAIGSLCTNEDSQSPEVKQFCLSYSKLIASKFHPKGLVLDQDHLYRILLRTKSNSIGFPFNTQETLGWALQEDICMINHCCEPNCALTQSPEGLVVLRTLRPVAADEEITISYVDLANFQQLELRQRHLLQQYRFLCSCSFCAGQRNSATHPK